MSQKTTKIDFVSIFFSLSAILIVLGFMILLSASAFLGLKTVGDPFYVIKRQAIFLCLAVFLGVFVLKLPKTSVRSLLKWGYFVALFLVFLTLIPGIGHKVGGAQRWLLIGPFSFQPVELLKVTLAGLWAHYFANKHSQMKAFKQGLLPIILITLPALLALGLQPDLGNTLLIMMVFFLVLLVSNTKVWHLLSMAAAAVGMVFLSVLLNPYQLQRIKTFLNPEADPYGQSYHILQSFTAIGSGGFLGLGIGGSKLKFDYLPLFHSDFIFSVLAEEGGFVLALFTVLCFLAFVWSGLGISSRCPDIYGKSLILALLLFMSIQAFINIAVVLGVFPTTGIPLTFISYGGSSLMFSILSLVLIAVMMKPDKQA